MMLLTVYWLFDTSPMTEAPLRVRPVSRKPLFGFNRTFGELPLATLIAVLGIIVPLPELTLPERLCVETVLAMYVAVR